MNKIIIKQADTNDLVPLFDLSAKFTEFNVASSGNYDKFFWPNWEQEFKDEILEDISNENGVLFVALDKEIPVGYIHAKYCVGCNYFLIDELYVEQEYRGKKIGEKLLESAVEWGEQFNVPIRVEIFEWNKKAVDFYLKQGFKIDSIVLEKPKKE